ncbi:hypothetical protein [Vreelandella venusta]|nr:hypothetical protein [Halomonas venusta]GEK52371.1 hypothetical protein HVE01_30920 [Halomonas venusta]
MIDLTKEEEEQLLKLLEEEEYLSLIEDSISKDEWINLVEI